MKVSIYEDAPVKDKELEFKLKLFVLNDYVIVSLADEKGERVDSSSLVSFNKNMKLSRCSGINSKLGLPLDKYNKLETENEDEPDW